MTHYDEQREGHFVGKTDTQESEKDLWQTPPDFFERLNREFDFDVDVCASEDNRLCMHYFSEKYSALDHEWTDTGFSNSGSNKSFFINPPYSMTKEFLERAAQQASKHNITVVALVNANTDTKWFSDAAKTANEIRLITGRLSFVSPSGKKANGNTKGQCVIVWRGKCSTPCHITMIDR